MFVMAKLARRMNFRDMAGIILAALFSSLLRTPGPASQLRFVEERSGEAVPERLTIARIVVCVLMCIGHEEQHAKLHTDIF